MLPYKWPILIIALVSTVLVSIWFHSGNILGGGEAGLPFYNLAAQGGIARYAWASPALGNSVSLGVGSFPLYLFLSQFQVLGVPPFVIQALFFWGLIFIAGISVYFLTKVLFTDIQPKFALMAVFFYLFNPISLVNVWNRSLENFRVFWAFLPLFLLLYLLGIKTKKYIYALIIGLATGIFSYGLTAAPFDILLAAVSFYITLFYVLTDKLWKQKIFNIVFSFFTLISVVLVNLWWISQLFSFIFSSDAASSFNQFYIPAGDLYTLSVESQLLGQWSYILRSLHLTFFAQGPGWAGIYLSLPWTIVEFLVPIFIIWIFIKYIRTKEVVFLGTMWIGILLLIRGNLPPFGKIFEYFFLKFFVLQAFRNPFEKFGFILPLVSAPLFAFGVQKISRALTKIWVKRTLIGLCYMFFIVFWGFPFWTGLVFTRTETPGSIKLVNYEVKVPQYYQQANSWMNSQGSNFRFISVPLGGEGMSYNWSKPYSGVELSSTLFDIPNISFNTTIPYFTEISAYLSDYQFDKKILDFLPFINGRFIVVRSDIGFVERNLPDPKEVEATLNKWSGEGLLTKKYEVGKLIIYEVDKSRVWPKIYMTPRIIVGNEDDLSRFGDFAQEFPQDPLAIMNIDGPDVDKISNRLLKPTKVLSSSSNSPAELTFPLPINDSDYFVSYNFKIPFAGKYQISINDSPANIRWYFDGKSQNISQLDQINLDQGAHELTAVGTEPDFLEPIILKEEILVNDNQPYKQKFDVPRTPTGYRQEFDYIFNTNSLFQTRGVFDIKFLGNIDNPSSAFFSLRVAQNNLMDGWNHAKNTFELKGGATSVDLQMIPIKVPVCNNNWFLGRDCIERNLPFSATIKNFQIKQVKYPKPLLISSLPIKPTASKTYIEWEEINPTRYKVNIGKEDSVPEALVFSELFNSGWRLYQDGKQLESSRHFLANMYANGWMFDKPGNYNLILEFAPQRLLYIGKIVSFLSFLVFSLYLGKHLIFFLAKYNNGKRLNS